MTINDLWEPWKWNRSLTISHLQSAAAAGVTLILLITTIVIFNLFY